MDLDIIFDAFWLLLCSNVCRMSKTPSTKRNSGKHQEHADNCRNMQTSSARKKQITKLRSRYCKLQNADSCNKRQSSNTGAAVLAPLGAFGSAAPVSQSGVSRRVRSSLGLLQTPDLRRTPPYPPTHPAKPSETHLADRKMPKSEIFGRLFADQKLIKNQTPQKRIQNLKSRTPDRPNVDFGITFGVHLGIDVHEILDFVIISENHRNAYI